MKISESLFSPAMIRIWRLCSRSAVTFRLLVNPILRRAARSATESRLTRLDGLAFKLDPRDYTQRKALVGRFERREIKFLQSELQIGDIAVDVGANVGLLSVPMAHAVGTSGMVICVEPIKENAEQLRENMRLNTFENWTLINSAAGSEVSVVRMDNKHSSADVSGGHFHKVSEEFNLNAITVDVVRLDSVLLNTIGANMTVKCLKLDVEGMEKEALVGLGTRLTPSSIEMILFEVFVLNARIDQAGRSVISFLESSGYTISRLDRKARPRPLKRLLAPQTLLFPNALNLVAMSN